ncbi:hypothetical protein [Rouxiella sp. WC2420]|uniref:Uncharacterized protein n=1 Tax=Rouxiella sp. WC2420 TaxID=3234145 RepID=A0AB39VVH3_9GAMM
MEITAQALAFEIYKQKFSLYSRPRNQSSDDEFNYERNNYRGRVSYLRTWQDLQNQLSFYQINYDSFFSSEKGAVALGELAGDAQIEPEALVSALEFAKHIIESAIFNENFYGILPENWPEQLFSKVSEIYGDKIIESGSSEEISSLAVSLNQKTDEYLKALNEIKAEYQSLRGNFRNSSSSTYSYDSGQWMGIFIDGLSKFLDTAFKKDFNVEEFSAEVSSTLGSELYLLRIEGIKADDSQDKVTFAQAFDRDVVNFSRTGTYAHTISNGKVALYVTLKNLGNDERLLYKNGQVQYWRLGSLITI